MSITKLKHRPLRLGASAKHDVRTQFGALCWRRHKDGVQVLLITGRRSGKWGIPKGWPLDGATPAKVAAREAWEEAGARGRTTDVCLGIYAYAKTIANEQSLPCVVAIFPLEVRSLADSWPEAGTRKRKWVSPKKAASLVDIPELKRILRDFRPRDLPR
jgi:8-oxo-dGTP pyrophosphatase MutT (NUDIX family)